jgi:hypothetical protein
VSRITRADDASGREGNGGRQFVTWHPVSRVLARTYREFALAGKCRWVFCTQNQPVPCGPAPVIGANTGVTAGDQGFDSLRGFRKRNQLSQEAKDTVGSKSALSELIVMGQRRCWPQCPKKRLEGEEDE